MLKLETCSIRNDVKEGKTKNRVESYCTQWHKPALYLNSTMHHEKIINCLVHRSKQMHIYITQKQTSIIVSSTCTWQMGNRLPTTSHRENVLNTCKMWTRLNCLCRNLLIWDEESKSWHVINWICNNRDEFLSFINQRKPVILLPQSLLSLTKPNRALNHLGSATRILLSLSYIFTFSP